MAAAAPPLSAFCIGCTKYTAGDTIGKLLAVICTAPYFAVYHCAVAAHARRELHLLLLFLGMLVNAGLSMAIKRAVQQPRPDFACVALNKCGYGWPSSHMQTMAFALVACLLLLLRRRHLGAKLPSSRSLQSIKAHRDDGGKKASNLTTGIGPTVELLEVAGLAVATAGTAVGRIYLGYHTVGQVAAGALLGTAAAALWFYSTLLLARSGALQRLEQALAPTGLQLHCAW